MEDHHKIELFSESLEQMKTKQRMKGESFFFGKLQ